MRLRTHGWHLKPLTLCEHATQQRTCSLREHFVSLQVWQNIRFLFYGFWYHATNCIPEQMFQLAQMHREPCMDILYLLVDLCQTHCVPSVNLSRECFLSAAYTPLKGNGRQAWPLTRAIPVNQHSASLAVSPHQTTTDGCKGNSVGKDAMKETITPPPHTHKSRLII